MGRSGDSIDYSLRVQKNVERKILGDVIRTLNYFNYVENYRYVGFGSFYYKDFLLLHEKYNIHSGISIEKDNRFYAKKDAVILRYNSYLSHLLANFSDEIELWRENSLIQQGIHLSEEDVDRIVEKSSVKICDWFIERVKDNIGILSDVKIECKSSTDFSSIAEDIIGCSSSFTEVVKDFISPFFKADAEDNYACCDDLIESFAIPTDDLFNVSEYKDYILDGFTNRYIYNKPFGFIHNVFSELVDAYSLIDWQKDKNNIIWLDYDSFLDKDQIEGLYKSILHCNRGDLIIFSTSMGADGEDKRRYEDLNELKEETGKIVQDIFFKECNTKGMPLVLRRIVKDIIDSAIAYKNTIRPDGESAFFAQPVVECTYADGMPMYTYGIVIYDEKDNINDIDFPGRVLQEEKWFPNDERVFSIYVPALTHKEINAINQMLPQKNVDDVMTAFPFLERKKVVKYLDIWRYYPNY